MRSRCKTGFSDFVDFAILCKNRWTAQWTSKHVAKNTLFGRTFPFKIKTKNQFQHKAVPQNPKTIGIVRNFYCFYWAISDFTADDHHRPSSLAWCQNRWT
jgi:hypothetical protein